MLLAQRTLRKLRATFHAHNHRPSPAQWDALADLARTLEAMADGTAEPKFYLSSLDPGVGKSQTLIHFVDALLAFPAYEHVGVLLCASRLTEVKRLVDDIGIPPGMLCVFTSDPEKNAMGAAEIEEARVVITTQQMVERRLAERTFGDAGLFPFNGKPRAVRIWDEAFLPGRPVTVNRYDINRTPSRLIHLSRALADDVDAIQAEVRTLKQGDHYTVPDLVERHPSVTLNDLIAVCEGDAKDTATVDALWYLSGKTVTAFTDAGYGSTVLDYRETLPADLAPMVILDASGRVRSTYRDMEKSRQMLVPLLTAPKRYDRLTVNVWQTGGGKGSFADKAGELCAGVAKTIESKPNEKWLVVAHKAGRKTGDTEDTVRKLLEKTPQDNVTFITWGAHSATNKHASVPNVILAGTLFYRGSHYEALKRLAAGRRATDGDVSIAERKETELGEHAHLLLQALCRGSVRGSDGEHCCKAEAWLIADKKTGIPDALPTIFPGCVVKRWSPVPKKLKGNVALVSAALESWAKTAKVGDVLPFRSLQRSLGIDAPSFKDEVRRSGPLAFTLAELGIEEWGKAKWKTAYRLVSRPAPELADAA